MPCLDDDFTPVDEEALCFCFFLFFFFVSELTSGEVAAGLLPCSVMLVKSLEQGGGGFEAPEISSVLESSEPEASESEEGLGFAVPGSSDGADSFVGVF